MLMQGSPHYRKHPLSRTILPPDKYLRKQSIANVIFNLKKQSAYET